MCSSCSSSNAYSDKYANVPYTPITIPEGASFRDMAALKGKSYIGDHINKKIIAHLADANKLSDMPDFNDPGKLGRGKEMVDRLTNLIAVFEYKALDFSKNRAEGDDILGEAYEYFVASTKLIQTAEAVYRATQMSVCSEIRFCCRYPVQNLPEIWSSIRFDVAISNCINKRECC